MSGKADNTTDHFKAFVLDFSLDMRTPLNSIVGHSKSVLDDPDGTLTDFQKQHIEAIHKSVLHLLALNHDLVDIAKLVTGKMLLNLEEINLTTIIHQVISTAKKDGRDQSIEFQNELTADLPTIRADSIRVRQILINLLGLAGHTTSIIIRLQLVQQENSPMVQLRIICLNWNISQVLGKDFVELLSNVDPLPLLSRGFSGLFIAKSLVNLHGGRMWIDTEPDASGTIQFTLPMFLQE